MDENQSNFIQDQRIMSDSVDLLATAFAKAQGEFSVAYKGSSNPFFKSNYADFEAIVKATRPALSKHGLSVVQPPVIFVEDGNSFLVTILLHSSGQWIKSTARHSPVKSDVQSLSSYNTYLKRMCYSSLVGVATSDDDDGEAALEPIRNQTYSRTLDKECISKDQQDLIERSLVGHTDIAGRMLKHYDIKSIDELQKEQFNYAIDKINELKSRKMSLQN